MYSTTETHHTGAFVTYIVDDIFSIQMSGIPDDIKDAIIFNHMEKFVHESLIGDPDISIVSIQRRIYVDHYHDRHTEGQLSVHLCIFHDLEICVTIKQSRMKSHVETRRLLIKNICDQLGKVMFIDYYSPKFSIGMIPQLITRLNLSSDDILCLLSVYDDRYELSGREFMILSMYNNNAMDSLPGYKKVSPIVIDIMSSLYTKHMRLFRAIDTAGNVFLSCRKEYKSLLLCEIGTIEPLSHSIRMGYYLYHAEPHYRNLLFRFFREEIWLCLFLFYSHIDTDIGRRLTMDYINLLLSRS